MRGCSHLQAQVSCDPGDVTPAPGDTSTRRVFSGCCGDAGLTFLTSRHTGPRLSPPFSVSAAWCLPLPSPVQPTSLLTWALPSGWACFLPRPPLDSQAHGGFGGPTQRRLLPVSPQLGAAPQSAILTTQPSLEGQPSFSPF